ncbi:DNA-binding response regulator [Alicyclobacillaceae bacterium I2511]|nr:DNA-binding response regulator [Alicyclobacillaceae bacterium I2511]
MIRIGIGEDQTLVRESLAVVLNLEPDFHVSWTAADGGETVRLAKQDAVDVLLVNLRMPDVDSCGRRVRLFSQGGAATIAGTAIRQMHAGTWNPSQWDPNWRRYAPEVQFRSTHSGLQHAIHTQDGFVETLTRREGVLLHLLSAGNSNADIAEKLHLSVGTVKNQLSSLYGKFSVQSRTEAIRIARERRWV